MKKKGVNMKKLTETEIREILTESMGELKEQYEYEKMVRVRVASFALFDFLELMKKERPNIDIFVSQCDGDYLVSWSEKQ